MSVQDTSGGTLTRKDVLSLEAIQVKGRALLDFVEEAKVCDEGLVVKIRAWLDLHAEACRLHKVAEIRRAFYNDLRPHYPKADLVNLLGFLLDLTDSMVKVRMSIDEVHVRFVHVPRTAGV